MKNTLLLLSLLSALNSFAQTKLPNGYQEKVNGFIAIYQNGLWGYADSTGKRLTEIKYEKLGPFAEIRFSRDGLFALTSRKGKLGLIDTFGKEILECKFDSIYNEDNVMIGKVGNKLTGVTAKGVKINPELYSYYGRLSDNLFLINEGKKLGIVDESGKMLIKPSFIQIQNCMELLRVNDGKAFGLMTRDGKLITKMEYHQIDAKFKDRYIEARKGNRYTAFTSDGRILVDSAEYLGMNDEFGILYVTISGKMGLYNTRSRKWITPPVYEQLTIVPATHEVSELEMPLEQRMIWGQNGIEDQAMYELLIPFGKDVRANQLSYDRERNQTAIILNGKYGLIDSTGNVLLPTEYKMITPFSAQRITEIPLYGDDYSEPIGVQRIKETTLATKDFSWLVQGNGVQVLDEQLRPVIPEELSKELESLHFIGYDPDMGYIHNACKTNGKCAIFDADLNQCSDFIYSELILPMNDNGVEYSSYQSATQLMIPVSVEGGQILFDMRSKKALFTEAITDLTFTEDTRWPWLIAEGTINGQEVKIDFHGNLMYNFDQCYETTGFDEKKGSHRHKKTTTSPGPVELDIKLFDAPGMFNRGKIDDKFYIIPQYFNGELTQFDELSPGTSDQLFTVFKYKKKYGLIDSTGTLMWPAKFESLKLVDGNSNYSKMVISVGKKQGMLSLKGDTLLYPIYDEITSVDQEIREPNPFFGMGYYTIRSKKTYRLYNRTWGFQGPEFTSYRQSTGDAIEFTLPNGKKSIVFTNGENITSTLPEIADEIGTFTTNYDYYFVLKNEGQYGLYYMQPNGEEFKNWIVQYSTEPIYVEQYGIEEGLVHAIFYNGTKENKKVLFDTKDSAVGY